MCHRGDEVLATEVSGTEPSTSLYAGAARDHRDGDIILKVVNPGGAPLEAQIDLSGPGATASNVKEIVLAGSNLHDQNTFERPNLVLPVESSMTVNGKRFTRIFQPHSLTVVRIKAE
jgi:alpha-L-arabinofuranosidase